MLGKFLGKKNKEEQKPQQQRHNGQGGNAPYGHPQQQQPNGQQQQYGQQQQQQQQYGRPQQQHTTPGGVIMGGVAAALGVESPYAQERWKTTDCQCDGFETCTEDWLCALFLPPAAGALARANVDGSNCCFNLLFAPPAFNYNVVRRRYGIIGDDGEDGVMATFCMPCAMRKALTESKMRGRIPNWGIYKWADNTQDTTRWSTDLCACPLMNVWCQALFFPCCVAGQARERFDDSSCLFNVFCSTPCAVNSMIRQGYGIEGNEGFDVIVSTVMWPWALQRSYYEAWIKWVEQMAKAVGQCCCNSCCGGK